MENLFQTKYVFQTFQGVKLHEFRNLFISAFLHYD